MIFQGQGKVREFCDYFDTLLSDACWNSSFGRWFLLFFVTDQVNSRSVKIVERSVKSQGTF